MLDQFLLFVELAQALRQLIERQLRARHDAHLGYQLADAPRQRFVLRALPPEFALPLFQLLIQVAPLLALPRDDAQFAGTNLGRQAEGREQALPLLRAARSASCGGFGLSGRRVGFALGRFALGIERQQFLEPRQRLFGRLQPARPGDRRPWAIAGRASRARLGPA